MPVWEQQTNMDRATQIRALNTTQPSVVAPSENNSSTQNYKPYQSLCQSTPCQKISREGKVPVLWVPLWICE